MTTTNTPSRVEEIVAKILKNLPRYAMAREDEMWWLKKLSNGAYADISDLDEILTEVLTELEAETVPSFTLVEETKEAYHSGYLSGVAEKERAVEAERNKWERYQDNIDSIFLWLLGENGDFPDLSRKPHYKFRTALREMKRQADRHTPEQTN